MAGSPVSIIIPVFNAELYIATCIQSVMTSSGWEIKAQSYFRPSLRKIIQSDYGCFKRVIRDIHHVLPGFAAPYWCY